MKKNKYKIRVTVFFILCLIGLMYLTIGTGKLHVGDTGYSLYVIFDDVAGLQENAPVMLNGLEVGRLEDIKVSYAQGRTKNTLKLLLKSGIKVWNDPVVSIKTFGLMGEKFVQISSLKGDYFLDPGAVIQGKPFMDLDVLMEQVQGLSQEVKKLTANLNETVEGNQDSVTQIVKNLETTTKNLEELSEDLKKHPWKLLFKPKDEN